MLSKLKFLKFFRVSAPAEKPYSAPDAKKRFSLIRWEVFAAATIGYGIYYVCRLSMAVIRKPIVDSGLFSEKEIGVIGSCMLFAYAIGKLANGFLADRCNSKRFLMTGLFVSAIINLILGFNSNFYVFAILWGVNGWVQSMGAPASVVSLSRWYDDRLRGSFYGFWSSSHNIGEAVSMLVIAAIATGYGWRFGMASAGAVGLITVLLVWLLMRDTPQSQGFLFDEGLTQNNKEKKSPDFNAAQITALKNPAIWIVALSSAFMYVSRYGINGWGIYYLEAEKGYSLTISGSIVGVSAVCGVFGTVLSGVFSDLFFKGSRNIPVLIFGLMNTISLTVFLFVPDCGIWLDYTAMVFFGLAIGALICYLGGLMAVDFAPRNAAGAALGMIGIFSYVGAGIQDILSGALIENYKTVVDGVTHYNFTYVKFFWVGAALISTLLASCAWRAKRHQG